MRVEEELRKIIAEVEQKARELSQQEFVDYYSEKILWDLYKRNPELSRQVDRYFRELARSKGVADEVIGAADIWDAIRGLSKEVYRNENIIITVLSSDLLSELDEKGREILKRFADFTQKRFPEKKLKVRIGRQPVSVADSKGFRIGLPNIDRPVEDMFPYLSDKIIPLFKELERKGISRRELWAFYDWFHELAHSLGITNEEEADLFVIKMAKKYFKDVMEEGGREGKIHPEPKEEAIVEKLAELIKEEKGGDKMEGDKKGVKGGRKRKELPKPEEVELTRGLPITFRDHLNVFGTPEAALAMMKQRCEAGHDFVCAAYIDQIEHYIERMMLEPNPNIRGPVMAMLYDIEFEVADWIDNAWSELSRKYELETSVSERGFTIYRFKGMPEEKMKAILKRKADELIRKFEDLLVERLGQERYMKIYDIRRKVRSESGAPLPPLAPTKEREVKAAEEEAKVKELEEILTFLKEEKKKARGEVEEEEKVEEKKAERVERAEEEELMAEVAKLKKLIEETEKCLKEKIEGKR
ncbi:hypothetical protein DRJ16_02685 [Candidatus Woesearchaeota archaeon]|nr:MAG: hypothetical protein DRJ16_02685 [Candidatus Woesearchaeota archaeon]